MRAAELYATVMRLAEVRELWVMHVPASATLARGWPDLTILGPRGVIFRKLLDEHGQLARDPSIVLDILRRSGINAGLWRPAQLHDGTVERELDMVASERPKILRLRCEACRQPFTATLSSRRFCSGRCRMKYARQVRKQKDEAAGRG